MKKITKFLAATIVLGAIYAAEAWAQNVSDER